jgi:hypothetical protein
MSGLIGVEEQVDKDFHRALLKASLHRWRDRLCRDLAHEHLRSFDKAKGDLVHWSQAYRGMKTVEVEKITGSVGRCRDFDESFLPLRVSMAHRWGRVDRAYHQGVVLPPVSLYKIGEVYFVCDGNHRVSVAKYHKVAAIDAEVVEIRGQIRTDVAQCPTGIAGAPTHRPQHAPEPNVSLLHSLWQRLRPGPLRPAAQRVT